MSQKSLNLAYLSITNAKLGHGLFESEGERWWATPPDLDVLLEVGTALNYVRKVAAPDSVPERPAVAPTVPKSEEAAAQLATSVSGLQQLLEPDAAPAVRAHQAWDRLVLHPVIDAAWAKVFRDGHYRNAVLDAGIALVNYVKLKARSDLDGASLMHKVFSAHNPTLAFNRRQSQSEKDEQEGLMHLFAGAVQAFRNPRAHALDPDSPEEALETIAFLSFLAKRLDRARCRRP